MQRIRSWWMERRPAPPLPGRRLLRLRRLLTLALVVVGALTGAAAALALFHYDGREPVNLAQVIGVFVVLQILLAGLSILMLPTRIPIVSAVQDALAELSPGAIAAALARRWLPGCIADMAPFGWQGGRASAAARFARWQAFALSQWLGLAFNSSALICALALVTFTDLAFAWSTTLAVDAGDVARITRLLALPFAGLAPLAVPDAALIESTRFSRIEGISALPPSSGGWWPFVALAMLFWGVLPRVVLLTLATWRLHLATRDLLLEDPGVTALLDRMATPVVAQSPASGEVTARAAPPDHGGSSGTLQPGEVTAVIWSAACDAAMAHTQLRSLGLRAGKLHAAGGSNDLDQDGQVIAAVRGESPPRVALICRGFEPPVLELLDFIEALSAANPECSLVLVLLGDRERAVGEHELAVWRAAVRRTGIAKVYVEAPR